MTIELPDAPRWVEAHGIAGEPDAWRESLGHGFALGHDAARLVVIGGDADPAAAAALARARPGHVVLFAIEREDLRSQVAAAGRAVERAILHTLVDVDRMPELEGAVLLGDAALDHVPAQLAGELGWARARSIDVWTVWVDGAPVSFAYAPWRSGRWFDVSVDTLPSARQLGLATVVAAAMIRNERACGREPVWGADEGNHASLALAHRLGFEPMDELWVAASA
jgi:GNAT superfamily N-acetyltransferase